MKPMILSKGPEGTLSRKDLAFIALGQVVGSGIVTLVGVAQNLTGASAWVAYAAAVFVGFFLAFPYFIIGSSLRLGGGPYSAVYALLGEKASGAFLMGQIPACIGIATYPIAIGTYAKSIWPEANVTVVALVVLLLFFVVNLLGVDIFAKVQNVMGYVLLGAMAMFIIVGFFKIDWNLLTAKPQGNFFSGGLDGFLAAVFLFCYSTHGYYFAVGFGKDAKNARKDIPVAMAVCIPIIFVMYTGVAMVDTGVLPIEQVAGQPLTLVASYALPRILFLVFMIGGVLMALTTSLNAVFGFNSRMIGTGINDGWLPPKLAKVNKRGTPTYVLLIILVVGLIPILSGYNVSQITNNLILLNSSLTLIMYAGAFVLPKLYPEQWATSTMHMPNWLFYTLMTLSTIAQGFMIYYSIRGIGRTATIISLSAIAAVVIYAVLRVKAGKVHAQPSVWTD